jgi:hypothetical protein
MASEFMDLHPTPALSSLWLYNTSLRHFTSLGLSFLNSQIMILNDKIVMIIIKLCYDNLVRQLNRHWASTYFRYCGMNKSQKLSLRLIEVHWPN